MFLPTYLYILSEERVSKLFLTIYTMYEYIENTDFDKYISYAVHASIFFFK